MRKIVVIASVAAVFLLVAAGGLLTLEILFRLIVGPRLSRDAQLDVTLFPYSPYLVSTQPPGRVVGRSRDRILESAFGHGECDDEGGVTARFNSLGFRSPEFTNLPPKKPDEVRIIITGGSAAVSWGIGERCTLDRKLAALLSNAFPEKDFHIFNMGGATWISTQELIAIQLYGLDIQPDFVVAFDGFNDIEHAYHLPVNEAYTDGHIRTAFNRYARWSMSKPLGLFGEFKIVYYAKRLSARRRARETEVVAADYPALAAKPAPGSLGTRLEKLPVNLEAAAARTDFDPHNRRAVDNHLKNIRLMAASVSPVGARLVAALQPTLYLKTPLSAYEEERLWKYYAPEVNFVAQGYARMRDGLARMAGESSGRLVFLDLSDAFNGTDKTYFSDYCHFNLDGYDVIAARLAAPIQKDLQTK